jgi:hypothetical protein
MLCSNHPSHWTRFKARRNHRCNLTCWVGRLPQTLKITLTGILFAVETALCALIVAPFSLRLAIVLCALIATLIYQLWRRISDQ